MYCHHHPLRVCHCLCYLMSRRVSAQQAGLTRHSLTFLRPGPTSSSEHRTPCPYFPDAHPVVASQAMTIVTVPFGIEVVTTSGLHQQSSNDRVPISTSSDARTCLSPPVAPLARPHGSAAPAGRGARGACAISTESQLAGPREPGRPPTLQEHQPSAPSDQARQPAMPIEIASAAQTVDSRNL